MALAVAALGLTGCSSFDEPNPTPQTNPQEPIFQTADLTVEAPLTSGTVALQQLADSGAVLPLNLISLKNFPEASSLKMVMEVAPNDKFMRVAEVDTEVINDSVIVCTPNALNAAFSAVISKSSNPKDICWRYVPYAVNGTEQVRIGGPDFYYGPYTANILPIPSEYFLPEVVYTPNQANGWNFDASQALQYNGDVFWGMANIDFQYGFKFGYYKFGEQVWIGLDEDGQLSENGDKNIDADAGYENGLYWLNFNFDEMTFTQAEVEFISIAGGMNGWTDTNLVMVGDSYLQWTLDFTVEEDTEFKFRINHGWDMNLGGSLDDLQWNADNMKIAAGHYTLNLDLRTLPLTAQLIKQ